MALRHAGALCKVMESEGWRRGLTGGINSTPPDRLGSEVGPGGGGPGSQDASLPTHNSAVSCLSRPAPGFFWPCSHPPQVISRGECGRPDSYVNIQTIEPPLLEGLLVSFCHRGKDVEAKFSFIAKGMLHNVRYHT